jgi:hypothetical protein
MFQVVKDLAQVAFNPPDGANARGDGHIAATIGYHDWWSASIDRHEERIRAAHPFFHSITRTILKSMDPWFQAMGDRLMQVAETGSNAVFAVACREWAQAFGTWVKGGKHHGISFTDFIQAYFAIVVGPGKVHRDQSNSGETYVLVCIFFRDSSVEGGCTFVEDPVTKHIVGFRMQGGAWLVLRAGILPHGSLPAWVLEMFSLSHDLDAVAVSTVSTLHDDYLRAAGVFWQPPIG